MQAPSGIRPQDIRNIALLGHAGSGKTSLSEATVRRTRAASAFDRVAATRFNVAARAVIIGHGPSRTGPLGDSASAWRISV